MKSIVAWCREPENAQEPLFLLASDQLKVKGYGLFAPRRDDPGSPDFAAIATGLPERLGSLPCKKVHVCLQRSFCFAMEVDRRQTIIHVSPLNEESF
jgi:hypothetical protein